MADQKFIDLEQVPDAPLSTADHAPLPWKHCGCGKCGLIWSVKADGLVAKAVQKSESGEWPLEVMQANAQFIVRAVNAHDALVAAMPTVPHPGGELSKVVAHYEDGTKQTIDGKVICDALALTRGESNVY